MMCKYKVADHCFFFFAAGISAILQPTWTAPTCSKEVQLWCSQVSCCQSPITKEMSCHTLIADLYTNEGGKPISNYFSKEKPCWLWKWQPWGQNNLISGKINTRLFRCCCAKKSHIRREVTRMHSAASVYATIWYVLSTTWTAEVAPCTMAQSASLPSPSWELDSPRPLCFGSQ